MNSMSRAKFRQILKNAISYVILIFACLVTILPMVYMISTSLKGPTQIFEFPPRFIPTEPTLINFSQAWRSNQFSHYFMNSVIVTLITTMSVVLLAGLMSYAFAFINFVGKKVFFSLVMSFMTMPVMVLIIPQFELANRFDLIDTLPGLIVVYIAQNIPLAVFILTDFFKKLPTDLLDAAAIDGANDWAIFWNIILPLSKPALATVTIFASLGAWDEFVWANTIINTSSRRTLPVGIAAFHGVHSSNWGLIFAASLITVAPIIILFVFLQRYFIKGAVAGAIKG